MCKILLVILIVLEQVGLFPQIQKKLEDRVFVKEDLKIASSSNLQNESSGETEIAILPYQLSQRKPLLFAQSFLVLDLDSSSPLYEKNSRKIFAPASLTKIMTAILVLEKGNLQDTVTISQEAVKTEGNSLNLQAGEKVKVIDLLYGLLLPSSNDAASALAEYLGKKSRENFVGQMNEKAKELELLDTQFKNPSGLDAKGQYSTAWDLAFLTKYALKFPLFLKIVKAPEYQFSTLSGHQQKIFNTNLLLKYPQVYGVQAKILGTKTGQTEKAGLCLISLAEKNGKKIITVTLGSPSRFWDTASLINHTYQNFIWQ